MRVSKKFFKKTKAMTMDYDLVIQWLLKRMQISKSIIQLTNIISNITSWVKSISRNKRLKDSQL